MTGPDREAEVVISTDPEARPDVIDTTGPDNETPTQTTAKLLQSSEPLGPGEADDEDG